MQQNAHRKFLCELSFMEKCLQKSVRKYESIRIYRLSDHEAENYVIHVMFNILKQFAGSVKQITFYNTSLKDVNFIKIIQILKNLKILKFERCNSVVDQSKAVREIVRPDILPSIHEISIEHVFEFAFQKLYLFNTITTLEVNNYMNTVDETFENFLLMQKNLKVLHLRKLCLLFKTDELTKNIKFSLDELTLEEVVWTYIENAMMFFRSQINLKKVTLKLHKININYDEFLVHLFRNNFHLKTVALSTSGYIFEDLTFLEGIVNSSVEHLELDLDESQNATELIAAFTKLFPNVKNFHYKARNVVNHGLEQIQNWKYLESINCNARYINSFLENVNSGKKLTTCIINCFYVIDIRKPLMIEFLNRHQNIKHMTLNPHYGTTAPDEVLSLVVKTLKSLETLIWNSQICSFSKYLK